MLECVWIYLHLPERFLLFKGTIDRNYRNAKNNFDVVVVDFPLFVASSGLIRGCNTWKGNTWERYERPKYYESYLKPLFIEMKWKNCDINVS